MQLQIEGMGQSEIIMVRRARTCITSEAQQRVPTAAPSERPLEGAVTQPQSTDPFPPWSHLSGRPLAACKCTQSLAQAQAKASFASVLFADNS